MKNKKCTRCGLDITPDKGSLCPPCLDDWSEEFLKCLDNHPPYAALSASHLQRLRMSLKIYVIKYRQKGI